LNSCSRQRD